jgi:NAD-dependent dihydropyrimidine dehydrogenase PreA subunit
MTVKINKELCTKCGICMQRCPLDCLRADNMGFPHIQYDDCWYCGVCEYECPEKAIYVELPYLVR